MRPKNRLHKYIFLLFLLLAVPGNFACAQQPPKITGLKPTVILISFDGFRWDYPEKIETPNLHRLMREGVRAEGLIPSFPSKTFPNHYTIVTGLYPSHHGIVANNVWDPEFQTLFTMSKREEVSNGRWWGGEPLWVTAARQGQKSAPLFWPGSEAEIAGRRPTYWKPYDEHMADEARVWQLFNWLDLPQAGRPTFLTLYFSDADSAGHDFGPDSPETKAAIRKLDAILGVLIAGLRERGIFDQVNLIVVSDHGMAATSPDRTVFLDDYVNLADVTVLDWSPALAIRAKNGGHGANGDNETLYRKLAVLPHAHVYRKREVPERMHYRDNPRIAPIIAVMEEGWQLSTHKKFEIRKQDTRGDHGYDNNLKSMQGIFIARGPNFKAGKTLPAFSNTDIYDAMAAILRLTPAVNDGSLETLRPVMNLNFNKEERKQKAKAASVR